MEVRHVGGTMNTYSGIQIHIQRDFFSPYDHTVLLGNIRKNFTLFKLEILV